MVSVAHSPVGTELTDASKVKGWSEWDKGKNDWTVRAGAGVESLGKVRPSS